MEGPASVFCFLGAGGLVRRGEHAEPHARAVDGNLGGVPAPVPALHAAVARAAPRRRRSRAAAAGAPPCASWPQGVVAVAPSCAPQPHGGGGGLEGSNRVAAAAWSNRGGGGESAAGGEEEVRSGQWRWGSGGGAVESRLWRWKAKRRRAVKSRRWRRARGRICSGSRRRRWVIGDGRRLGVNPGGGEGEAATGRAGKRREGFRVVVGFSRVKHEGIGNLPAQSSLPGYPKIGHRLGQLLEGDFSPFVH